MTTMMIKQLTGILFILLLCKSLFAQHTDAATWLSAGISTDLSKDISLDLSEEMRYNISVEDLYQLNSDISLSYKFTKKIKVGLDYRYSVRTDADVNRTGFSLTLREGFKDLDFSIRSKFQYSFIPDQKEGTSWRNKGTLKYEGIKNFTPYFSTELFYSFSNDIDQFDNYRVDIGFDWGISKHHDLTPFYMFDKEFNVNDPLTMHIFGLGYVYKF